MPERRLKPDLAQWIVQTLTRLLATFALLQGASIIIGGVDRWRGPSLAVALTVPGAPESWGWALVLFGALALAGTFRPRLMLTAAAVFAIGAWCLFFAGSFVIYLTQTPNAPTTGIFTYGFLAVNAFVLAVAYGRSRP